MEYCSYLLKSPRWGNSNDNKQHTSMLKKIEKISLLSLLTLRYDLHSWARTTLARTYFHGSKGVRAIEDSLYLYLFHMFMTQITSKWKRKIQPYNSMIVMVITHASLAEVYIRLNYYHLRIFILLTWCTHQRTCAFFASLSVGTMRTPLPSFRY